MAEFGSLKPSMGGVSIGAICMRGVNASSRRSNFDGRICSDLRSAPLVGGRGSVVMIDP